jgi:hypothetical protein
MATSLFHPKAYQTVLQQKCLKAVSTVTVHQLFILKTLGFFQETVQC